MLTLIFVYTTVHMINSNSDTCLKVQIDWIKRVSDLAMAWKASSTLTPVLALVSMKGTPYCFSKEKESVEVK